MPDDQFTVSVPQFQPVERSGEPGRRREQHGAEACREALTEKVLSKKITL